MYVGECFLKKRIKAKWSQKIHVHKIERIDFLDWYSRNNIHLTEVHSIDLVFILFFFFLVVKKV
jgi:hypothetical protein